MTRPNGAPESRNMRIFQQAHSTRVWLPMALEIGELEAICQPKLGHPVEGSRADLWTREWGMVRARWELKYWTDCQNRHHSVETTLIVVTTDVFLPKSNTYILVLASLDLPTSSVLTVILSWAFMLAWVLPASVNLTPHSTSFSGSLYFVLEMICPMPIWYPWTSSLWSLWSLSSMIKATPWPQHDQDNNGFQLPSPA